MQSIANNLLSQFTNRQLKITTGQKTKSSEKLSSGYKINRSADDAAGLAISEKLRWQARGLSKGVQNSEDGVSLCQVADGALSEVSEMLHRLTELSVQAANDTNTKSDRDAIQKEINQLLQAKVEYSALSSNYESGSLQYAIINAFNACLLGKVFSSDEFQLETGDGERVKIEVRSIRSKFVDLSTLYVKPETFIGERFVNSYLTETMNVINGDDMEKKTYRLSFKKSANNYSVAKCD